MTVLILKLLAIACTTIALIMINRDLIRMKNKLKSLYEEQIQIMYRLNFLEEHRFDPSKPATMRTKDER